MSATNLPTPHYVLHEFHYRYEDSELIGARRHCIFDLRFTMDGKAMKHEADFSTLLRAAEAHAPKVYGYIHELMEEIDAIYPAAAGSMLLFLNRISACLLQA